MIEVTDTAAAHLRQLLVDKNAAAGTGLRLLVERGGCAGLQYAMTLGEPAEGDTVVGHAGVNFIVDAASAPYLRGSRVDYEDSLNDSGFKIHNPNAARSCGCGTSFEPAAPSRDDAAVPVPPPVPDGQACGTAAT
ncbi:MAG: iron-sulfur cluster assembly accessory protein [Verrucomicrobiaceae bacterium]|nr:MAG: iron-sulfur cluster assembly accessory protein [Verrucomicrobiaceae bacterium]